MIFISSPAPGYPIDNKHPSLPSKTAGITSDKAEAHTSSWNKIYIKNYYVSQFCDFIINNKCEVTAYASQENIKKGRRRRKIGGKFHSSHVIFQRKNSELFFPLLSLIYHIQTCAESS